MGGFPKLGVPFLEVPVKRIIVLRVYNGVGPILGNYHIHAILSDPAEASELSAAAVENRCRIVCSF